MRAEELSEKLSSGIFEEDHNLVQEALTHVPEKAVELLKDIERIQGYPKRRANGDPIYGEFVEEEKKIILYGPDFEPCRFFHEMGHCIYQEFNGAKEITNESYDRHQATNPLNWLSEGLSQGELDAEISEFMAKAYELYKLNEDIPDQYDALIEFFRNHDL